MTTPMASAPKQLETKWTPGPWLVQPSGVVYDARSIPIKFASGWREDAWCDDDQTDESIANAKLIAEAPAMAEALRQIAYLRPAGDVHTCKSPRALVKQMEAIALAALPKIGGDV